MWPFLGLNLTILRLSGRVSLAVRCDLERAGRGLPLRGAWLKEMRIKIVLAGGLALTAIAVFVALLHSPAMVIATNGVPATVPLGGATEDVGACQAGETLPAGTSAIRIALEATTGPRVSVKVIEGTRVITGGTEGPGWYGSVVTVPIRALRRAFPHAKVCFQTSLLTGEIAMFGARTLPSIAASANGKALPGRVRISYLKPSDQSWWSLAGSVIEHLSLGRAASGTWIVLPIAALGAAAIALGSWVLTRELS
jgi:hypothetical protein